MAKHHYLKLHKVLQKLLYDRRINPSELARETNTPVPTIHRMVTGKSTRPYRSSLQPIADYFSITIDQLLGEAPLKETSEIDSEELASQTKAIPLISWSALSGDFSRLNPDKKIPFIGAISSVGFATILPDASMEPMFAEQSILIFDPKKTHKDRSYVLALLGETKIPVFRQLLVDADQRYLKPLNPDLSRYGMRLMGEKDTLLGVLLEVRRQYHE